MICFSPRFFVPLVSPKLLALGKAKEKARFSFAFLSFFRNFARFLSFSLISKINPREYPLIKFKGHSFFFFVDKIH